MDVEVFDVDLAAAGADLSGKEFGKSGCPFRTVTHQLVRTWRSTVMPSDVQDVPRAGGLTGPRP